VDEDDVVEDVVEDVVDDEDEPSGSLPLHCVSMRVMERITMRQRTTRMEILRTLFICTPFKF
jgi:hypothetical protein